MWRKEDVDGVRKPGDLQPPVFQDPCPVDLLAGKIRNQLAVLEPAHQALIAVFIAELPQLNNNGVVGLSVDGVAVLLASPG